MTRYSKGAILLHWLIAFCLAFELALGFAAPEGARGFALLQLHKSLGITILALSLLRLLWRLTHARPAAPQGGLSHRLAQAVHAGFYLFMVLAPLTGWALASTAPVAVPTILFGLLPLPHLPLPHGFHPAAEEAHELLAWLGIALLVLHLAGALRHELLPGEGVLRRMAPGGRRAAGLVLGLAVPACGLGAFGLLSAMTGDPPPTVPGRPAAAPAAPAPLATVPAAPESAPLPQASPAPGAGDPAQDTSEAPSAPVPAALSPPPRWTIEPGGELGFAVGSAAGERIAGRFARWDGAIAFDPEHPETAEIRITIDLASASVGDATQDAMLAGEEFFAAARFATAEFRADSARRTGPDRYTANGTLRLKGTTQPQTIAFRLTGSGNQRRVEGEASVRRGAFAVGEGQAGSGLDPAVAVHFAFAARTEGR